MSFVCVDLKKVVLFILLPFLALEVYAQKNGSSTAQGGFNVSGVVDDTGIYENTLSRSLPVDTLRNYAREGTIFGWFANGSDQSGGWIHGTNQFVDVAKATKISLPDGVLGAQLTEVLVTFIYKAPTITTQTYSIEIREVTSDGAPGDLLDFQVYNMSDINADDSFDTDALETSHVFSGGVNVPQEFFVVVNFGSGYPDTDFQNVAIAASDNLGRFVEEDWELLSNNSWINMSESWFSDDPNNNGWYMWIDAVVNTDVAFNDPNEPNNTASQATSAQDGFVSSSAAIFPVGDVDYYAFDGTAGTTADVFAQAEVGANIQIDGIITIYNSVGDFIAENDDFNGSFTESRVTFTVPATDRYFIRYASFDNDTGADFPNKREEDGNNRSVLNSAMQKHLTGIHSGSASEKGSENVDSVTEVGAYTMQVTITGGGGGEDAVPPTIQHTPPSLVVPAGQEVVVQADVTDAGSGVETVLVAYLEGGRGSESAVISPMTLVSGNTYQASIPANFVNERGLQYLIAAADFAGNDGLGNLVNLGIRFDDGVSRPIGITGTDANSYRILSMPITLDNNSVRAVLEDDLGPYDPEVWRFWELQANQMYAEFPGVGAFTPGRAYWFATSQTGRTITSGPGTTVTTGFLVDVDLNPGWTFVGTPFNFPIDARQIALESGAAPDIRTFTGSWSTISGPMMPFQGYAVASVGSDRLVINPFIPETSKRSPVVASKTTEATYDWAVSVSASSGTLVDNDNVFAVSSAASEEWDVLDRPEPPVIGTYISLYFPHSDWDVPFNHFNTDVRQAIDDVQQWVFEVSTNVDEPIDITFAGIDSIPSEYQVHLVDRQMHYQQDLRESTVYTIASREEDLKERFAIVVGKSDSVLEELNALTAIPETITLRSYPNPFQTYMTLEFGLPEATEVSIDVYDLLGKRVARLIQDRTLDAGTHALQWQGTDTAGRPLANGIYLFAVQTGASRATQKVVLLR